ncbi:MAG: hypothetical protein PHN56_05155 [Candidatus Nanoarchaeia archaeon]|nr:hypothetical protein [Candidatus Nanoarchaeia archaeon]
MKFKNLDELIKFEEKIEWHNANSININDYSIAGDALAKYERLKNEKYVGIVGNKIVTAVSDQFSQISVKYIAEKCDNQFGTEYLEKTYKEGIIRIYNKGIENEFGKLAPLVVYPANLGNMAVKIGLYHDARVCSNGMILSGGKIGQRIIHKLSDFDIEKKLTGVSENLGTIVNMIDASHDIELNPGVQLAMIINSLGSNDKLISKAFEKYSPKNNSLWETVQTVTYVSTHETRDGYNYAINAGELIINKEITPSELVNAASYAYSRQLNGEKLPNTNELLRFASEKFNEAIAL